MIIMKPEDRLSVPEILGHPWVRDPEEEDEESDESDMVNSISMDRNEAAGASSGA